LDGYHTRRKADAGVPNQISWPTDGTALQVRPKALHIAAFAGAFITDIFADNKRNSRRRATAEHHEAFPARHLAHRVTFLVQRPCLTATLAGILTMTAGVANL
jgi:hypothetical protein